MLKRKSIREHGKLSFTKYFQKFQEGDRVAVIREQSEMPRFPKRIQGFTGVICGIRGKAYLIKITEGRKEKIYIIKPIHLKKIK